jgi:hypothetical protein
MVKKTLCGVILKGTCVFYSSAPRPPQACQESLEVVQRARRRLPWQLRGRQGRRGSLLLRCSEESAVGGGEIGAPRAKQRVARAQQLAASGGRTRRCPSQKGTDLWRKQAAPRSVTE